MTQLNYKIIFSFLGLTTLLNGAFMLLAVPFSLFHQENSYKGILEAGILSVLIGFLLWFFNRKASKNLQKKEGYLIVTLGWLVLALTGSLPYLFTGAIPNYVNAIFETMSGYSTTGASILTDIEALPKGILFWRSATQWIGGMGIIVLVVAVLPLLGIGGMQLFMAEAPGPSADKLHPRITETAKRLWLIYFTLTLIEFLLLKLAGMGWFDAINHAMTTMSTGGFSTKNASAAYWNHMPMVQYIIIFFMFIAGTNFILTYFLLKGKVKKLFKNEEYNYYFFGTIGTIITVTILINNFHSPNLHSTVYHPMPWGTLESSFRHAAFQVVSILTTTGFVSADYTSWNVLATMLIFALFFVGGSAGSTSGGVKVVRQILMIKHSILEFKKQLHPSAIIPLRYNKKSIHRKVILNILSFFVLYMFIYMAGAVTLTLFELDFEAAMGASASSLGNIGPAIGSLGPIDNYAHLTAPAKIFCAFLMLIGRLELFTVLVLLSPYFWRKN